MARTSRNTPATVALDRAGIAFELAAYDYDPRAQKVGMQAAAALGEAPARVLKTLVVLVDGKPACVIVPSGREVAMKKVAAAFGGKSAKMMPPADAERITGYKVGGVSPFGQRRKLPAAIEETALAEPYIYVNGGQRGLQIRLAPGDACRAADAAAVPLVA